MPYCKLKNEIDLNKIYRTQNGQAIRNLKVNHKYAGIYSITGERYDGQDWLETSWSLYGEFSTWGHHSELDLVEVPAETRMPVKPTIDLTKKYVDKKGRPIRNLRVDHISRRYPLRGERFENGEWSESSWMLTGQYATAEPSEWDLVAVEDTLDWKSAMNYFADDVAIQVSLNGSDWQDITDQTNVHFYHRAKYRVKPPEPDYTRDQGFREGDIVMVSDDKEVWYPAQYVAYAKKEFNDWGPHTVMTLEALEQWKFSRKFTDNEFEKVRSEEA